MPIGGALRIVLPARTNAPRHLGLHELVNHGQPDTHRECQQPFLRGGGQLRQGHGHLLGQIDLMDVRLPTIRGCDTLSIAVSSVL